MTELKVMYEKLQITLPKDQLPQIVFVSVDPARDNAARIQQFVSAYNPNFMGVTGKESQLSTLTQELGVLYMKIAENKDNSQDYQIDHSGTILLLDPKGELYAVFSMPHNPEAIAKDYEKIISSYG